MEDHTIVSLVSIAAGVILLIAEMITGVTDQMITPIAAAAIGAGIGIPIGAKVGAYEASPPVKP